MKFECIFYFNEFSASSHLNNVSIHHFFPSVSTTNSESSSSEILPSIREAPFCTSDILMTLFLYRALHLSQIIWSSCISLLISFETYFCNDLTFIGRLLLRCDLPQTAHCMPFASLQIHMGTSHQINPWM